MKFLMFIILLSSNALANEDLYQRWLTTFEITQLHPEYNLKEEIKHPEGTWQLIARIHSIEALGKKYRYDCLFVRVPKNNDGEIKIIPSAENQACLEVREGDSVYHLKNLKKITVQIQEDSAYFYLTDKDGRVLKENYKFLNTLKDAKFEIHSQPELREVTFFQPNSIPQKMPEVKLIGEMNDEYPKLPCDFDSGSCQKCRFGVYRINTNEYFCGIDQCGEKNNPACLRGSKWQHSREEFSCRGVNTHVFCRPGLKVECEGERAICR
ncbi:MAG: hypothetical protein K2P81_06005 [Bacteriovoracaceae bacterium]|nr:hypothetical protein [Bacteriovoracaceae bacterium]